jgi:[amino group carrier protein]-lysine/ornithine hydrolase
MNDVEATALLESMVRIASVSTQEHELAHWLAAELPRWGFRARVDAVGNLRANIGPDHDEASTLDVVLLGHIDTVPGDLPVSRSHTPDPRGEAWQERLYGRGSVDAKGPFAAFIAAASRIAAAQASNPDRGTPRMHIELIGCVEEEVPSSRGARHVLDRTPPDFCIVGEPSGWDGVTLGYKGCLNARLVYRGAGHHGAHPDASVCERASDAWQRIASAAAARGGDTLYEQLLTRLAAMQSAHHEDGSDSASLTISLRLPEDLPPVQAEAWLAEHAQADSVHIDGNIAAWSGPRHAPLVRTMQRAILQQGGRPRAIRKTGTADLNLVAPAWGCPAVAYGPGDAALDHTPNEHIVLEEFRRGIAVLCGTLTQLPALTACPIEARQAL